MDIFEIEEDNRLNSIHQIVDHNPNTKEYYATFDGDLDNGWITILNDTHEKVVEYYAGIEEKVSTYEAKSGDWMIPVWENQN